MGFLDKLLKAPFYRGQKPLFGGSEVVAEIVGIQPKGDNLAVLSLPRQQTQPYVYWDRPEPDVPPMQFPTVPGGDDPEVMLSHLQSLVASGALDPDGLERVRAYLESGRRS